MKKRRLVNNVIRLIFKNLTRSPRVFLRSEAEQKSIEGFQNKFEKFKDAPFLNITGNPSIQFTRKTREPLGANGLIVICMLGCSFNAYALWNYDRGVAAGMRGDAASALSLLAPVVSDDPHNPTKLYDAGVAAFRTQSYDQAKTFFEQATMQPAATASLKENAHYNLGNTYVKLSRLEEALAQYEKALAINPDNKAARHNYDVVKKMLEQQKKQEPQQKDKNSSDEQQKNEQQDNQQQEQDKRDKRDEQQQMPDKQQDGQQEQDQQDQQQSSDQNREQNDQKNTSDEQSKRDDQRNAQEEKRREDERQQQSTPQEHKEKKQQDSERDAQKNHAEQPKLEPVLARILDEREQRDAQAHKRIIKGKVSKDLAGHHGQKCW